MTKFAPTVLVGGVTVVPPGWMWIFALAVNGCKWAVREASAEEFKETIRQWMKDRDDRHLRGSMEYHQREIERLRKELGIE